MSLRAFFHRYPSYISDNTSSQVFGLPSSVVFIIIIIFVFIITEPYSELKLTDFCILTFQTRSAYTLCPSRKSVTALGSSTHGP